MKAQAIVGAVEIISSAIYEDVTELEVSCKDFDQYETLPAAVTFNGLQFGKKGWNSDNGRCYYGTDKKVALVR